MTEFDALANKYLFEKIILERIVLIDYPYRFSIDFVSTRLTISINIILVDYQFSLCNTIDQLRLFYLTTFVIIIHINMSCFVL